jgi:hypothetical protein
MIWDERWSSNHLTYIPKIRKKKKKERERKRRQNEFISNISAVV